MTKESWDIDLQTFSNLYGQKLSFITNDGKQSVFINGGISPESRLCLKSQLQNFPNHILTCPKICGTVQINHLNAFCCSSDAYFFPKFIEQNMTKLLNARRKIVIGMKYNRLKPFSELQNKTKRILSEVNKTDSHW